MKTREDLVNDIKREHAVWRALVTEVGEDRMEQPGPMGDWTFKDLTAHLEFWNERTIAQVRGSAPPAWPAALGTEGEIEDWDEINAWIYEQHRDRPLADVLAAMDRQYERFVEMIEQLPDETLLTPGHFDWMGDRALVEAQFFGHLHEEHMPSIRAWLDSQPEAQPEHG